MRYAEANAGIFTYRVVANKFRDKVRSEKGINRGIGKGLFGPIYAQDSDPIDQSNNKRDAFYRKRKVIPNKKRQKDNAPEESVCLACDLPGHCLAKCYYAFPKKVYKGFKPRKSI